MQARSVLLKDGRAAIIREAIPSDATALNDLIHTIISTSPYTLTTIPELELSEEDQARRIRQFHEGEGQLILVVEWEGQLVGSLDFKNAGKLRNRHLGEFGMGFIPEFRGLGLGTCILKELLDWAENNAVIEKVCLGVFAENKAGMHLYQKMGFIEEGRGIKAIKVGPGQYADEVRMYKWVSL